MIRLQVLTSYTRVYQAIRSDNKRYKVRLNLDWCWKSHYTKWQ